MIGDSRGGELLVETWTEPVYVRLRAPFLMREIVAAGGNGQAMQQRLASADLIQSSFAEFAVNRRGYDADRARHCDIREQTLPSVGRLSVEGHNGSATVKGCLRSDVLVGARVDPAVEVQAADLLLLPNEYFAAENRILRAQLPARTTHPG